jgi:outer membrane protein, multidrug efflux system
MRRLLVFILLAQFLLGCAIGPDYHRPSVGAPENWRFPEAEALDTTDILWWRQFDDPVLDGLIESALKENKDIKTAAARVEEFLGRFQTTRASLFPQANAGSLVLRKGLTRYSNPPPSPTLENPFSDYQVFAGAAWEVDIWGRLRRATEAARADLMSTEEGRRAIILTVVTSVAVAYTQLRDFDRQLEIAERTVRGREESARLFRLRFGRGLISEVELSQVESEWQSARATIPLLQRFIAEYENLLSVLLGRNPGAIPRGRTIDDLVLPAVPAGLPSDLLVRRPDVRQAEQSLIAANARIGVVRAAYFPTVSLTGLFGVESVDLSRLFTGPARMWSYAVPVSVPVFNSGAIAGAVKTAEAVRDESLFRYQQVIQQAFREVEDGLIDQIKIRQQLDAQRQQVDALRNYARLARLRYENGYTSYLEVLDAERSLFAGELSFAQTKGNLFLSLVGLYKSMGGGWVVQAEQLSGG